MVSSETGQRVVNGTQMERAPSSSFKSFARSTKVISASRGYGPTTDALQLHATSTGGGNRNDPGMARPCIRDTNN